MTRLAAHKVVKAGYGRHREVRDRRSSLSELLEPGTFFIRLFFSIAPGIALGLLWRGGRRACRQGHFRKRIVGLTLAALALWAVATNFMFSMVFEIAWAVAHTRPVPNGFFPEGWPIYGYSAVYALFGATLVWAAKAIPPK